MGYVSQFAIDAFGQALDAVIAKILSLAARWGAQALAGAAAFAVAAEKVTKLLKDAAEGLRAISTMTEIPQAAISAFVGAFDSIMSAIIALASRWSADALAAASQFAGASATVARLLKDASTGLKGIEKLTDPQAAVDSFVTTLNYVLQQIT
jgi:predicted phage tail protein